MAVYFARVVTPATAYPTTPQVECPFPPKRCVVLNEDTNVAHTAFISFDGVSDQGEVLGGGGMGCVTEYLSQTAATKVWLKSAAATAVSVRFES